MKTLNPILHVTALLAIGCAIPAGTLRAASGGPREAGLEAAVGKDRQAKSRALYSQAESQ